MTVRGLVAAHGRGGGGVLPGAPRSTAEVRFFAEDEARAAPRVDGIRALGPAGWRVARSAPGTGAARRGRPERGAAW